LLHSFFSCDTSYVTLESKRSKSAGTSNNKGTKAKTGKAGKAGSAKQDQKVGKLKKENADTSFKFEQYFDFTCSIKNLKPHQVCMENLF
jgi:hypothetical protein